MFNFTRKKKKKKKKKTITNVLNKKEKSITRTIAETKNQK